MWREEVGRGHPTYEDAPERLPDDHVLSFGATAHTVPTDQLLWTCDEHGGPQPVAIEQWNRHVQGVREVRPDIGRVLDSVTAQLITPTRIPRGGLATDLPDDDDYYEMVWDGERGSFSLFLYGKERFDWLLWVSPEESDGDADVHLQELPLVGIGGLLQVGRI